MSEYVKPIGGLFDAPFDGDDYEDARDRPRLTGQIQRVYSCIVDGNWRTLNEIAGLTRDPHASVSAQLRHLRKPKFGGHNVEKRHRGDPANGLYEYRLSLEDPPIAKGIRKRPANYNRDES